MTGQPALLTLAVVMVAGPQIISATFLATSQRARSSSLSYILGVGLAVTINTTIVYYVARGAGAATKSQNTSSGNHVVDLVIIALLVVLLVHVYLNRKNMQPPKWMARLQTASPRFAFGLGFVLFLVMPTDIITEITAGMFQAARKAPWSHLLPFIGVTLFLVAIPLLLLFVLGHRATVVLPKVREWMTTSSWIVSEIVILLFLGITLSNL